ncbi:hypothetical protein OEZ85_005021 [Tetradesmus obliquus]|uniref:Uncharacterized protein n=1 Tax=Tetradesmus obliquus TaxID=3088 RepID=A0ABY8UKA4_TETOB|nr:hypothetical protein OEZ85_005021 [Tetradesmus obliquus]
MMTANAVQIEETEALSHRQQLLFDQTLVPGRAPLRVSAAVFHIGPFTFNTKAAAKDRARSILYREPIGRTINNDDREEFQILCYLLQRHPDVQQKLAGSEISHFSTITEETPGAWQATTHFILHRVDGTSEDFSFHKCLDAKQHGIITTNSSSGSSSSGSSSSSSSGSMDTADIGSDPAGATF